MKARLPDLDGEWVPFPMGRTVYSCRKQVFRLGLWVHVHFDYSLGITVCHLLGVLNTLCASTPPPRFKTIGDSCADWLMPVRYWLSRLLFFGLSELLQTWFFTKYLVPASCPSSDVLTVASIGVIQRFILSDLFSLVSQVINQAMYSKWMILM